jgi:hypothetical protein
MKTIDHVRRQHPEIPADLPSLAHAVEQAVRHPSRIEKSYGGSYVFVCDASTNRSGDPLRVPVKIVQGTSARLKTFYFATPSYAPKII